MVKQIAQVTPSFWQGKRVFLTGHTGFKGSWMALWLQQMGADVYGFALEPPTTPSLFVQADVANGMHHRIGDVRSLIEVQDAIREADPEIILHMAAQPLVRTSYAEPVETYATNVMGTVHVLEAARACTRLKSIVVVTTDKCYENREWVWGYREHEAMGGYDPYSSSKGCAELVTAAYRRSFMEAQGVALASARAGNVIGGGDYAQDRLIPDAIRAFSEGKPVRVRNPLATRPWQHVLEPLSGYLILAEALWHRGAEVAEAWNFGPRDEDCKAVGWILEAFTKAWGEGVTWEYDTAQHPHEARFLKLDCSKAQNGLQWHPRWTVKETLSRIATWHKQQGRSEARDLCLQEIKDYITT